MDITKGQIADIKKLVRAANRRLERASGGLESYIKSQIRTLTGGAEKFSASYKGFTTVQAQKKIEMLNKFLKNEVTKKSGFKQFKKEAISKSAAALEKKGYDLTDQELAEILDQIEAGSNEEFYRAINLVQAKKIEEGRNWSPSADKVAEILNQRIDFQDALAQALRANPNLKPGGN